MSGGFLEAGDPACDGLEISGLVEEGWVDGVHVRVGTAVNPWEQRDRSARESFKQRDGKALIIAEEQEHIPLGDGVPVGVPIEASVENDIDLLRAGMFEGGKIRSIADTLELEWDAVLVKRMQQRGEAVEAFLLSLHPSAEADADVGVEWTCLRFGEEGERVCDGIRNQLEPFGEEIGKVGGGELEKLR